MRSPRLLGFLLLAAPAYAQGDFTFQIDQGASAFTWSGTTSVGSISQNPPNFNLTGTVVMTMDGGGSPVGSGGFPGAGDAAVTPDIAGIIPNPLPFLPPLATLSVTNLHMRVSSAGFAVSGAGAFNTDVIVEMISGTLTVDPLTGGTSVLDLTGSVSDPTPVAGTIIWTGSQYQVNAPVNSTFPFADPGSGTSGSITLVGNIVANHTPEAPAEFCTSSPNSSGATGVMAVSGSTSLALANLALTTTGVPANTFGIYFYAPDQVSLPFGDGTRCVGGAIQRLAPIFTGALATANQAFDNGALPVGAELSVGQRTNVQFWFRDIAAGGAGFNTSNAMTILPMP